MNSRNTLFLIVGLLLGGVLCALVLRAPGLRPENSGTDLTAPEARPTQPGAALPSSQAGQQNLVPSLDLVRHTIDRAETWLEANPLHPTESDLPGFRFYALEVRAWYVLYSFAQSPVKKEHYRSKVQESIGRLHGGAELLAVLSNAPPRKYIADLLIVVDAAREVGSEIPAIEKALPTLIKQGLVAPNRPVGLQIALAWLIRWVGSDQGPEVSELRNRGMLATAPAEIGMVELNVYILTHEIFGLTDYGLRRGAFSRAERTYLERTLPFWTLFSAVMQNPDLGAELAICHQVTGMTGEYAYGQVLALVIASQSPEGFFQQQKVIDSAEEHMHTMMVALHALLGHEALATGRPLPFDR